MKYMTLMADYTQSCVRDDFSGPINLEDLSLPLNIIAQLDRWNNSYRSIIPLSEDERVAKMDLIHELDKEGLELSEQLHVLLQAKVRYFSEGLLKYLN